MAFNIFFCLSSSLKTKFCWLFIQSLISPRYEIIKPKTKIRTEKLTNHFAKNSNNAINLNKIQTVMVKTFQFSQKLRKNLKTE